MQNEVKIAEYDNCVDKLKTFKKSLSNENDIKKGKLYFSWITTKTNKIQNEKNKLYVYEKLIHETLKKYDINQYIYNKSNNNLQNIINNNYTFDGTKYKFSNLDISLEEALLLSKYIIFKRGNVVWVDFGFNIGNEFGGMHPAIILKNFDNELFVLPVSSKMPPEYRKIEEDYNSGNITIEEAEKKKNNITEIIQLNKIFGFKDIIRWSNITRMKKVSILRVSFSGSIGAINGNDLNIISEKIKKEF